MWLKHGCGRVKKLFTYTQHAHLMASFLFNSSHVAKNACISLTTRIAQILHWQLHHLALIHIYACVRACVCLFNKVKTKRILFTISSQSTILRIFSSISFAHYYNYIQYIVCIAYMVKWKMVTIFPIWDTMTTYLCIHYADERETFAYNTLVDMLLSVFSTIRYNEPNLLNKTFNLSVHLYKIAFAHRGENSSDFQYQFSFMMAFWWYSDSLWLSAFNSRSINKLNSRYDVGADADAIQKPNENGMVYGDVYLVYLWKSWVMTGNFLFRFYSDEISLCFGVSLLISGLLHRVAKH